MIQLLFVVMKGQTINFRKKDGSWVSGFFIPDSSTQVSLNSRKYYNYCRNDSSSIKNLLSWDTCPDQDLNYARYRDDYRLADMSRTVGAASPNRFYQNDSIREDRRMAESMRERPVSGGEQAPSKISLKSYVEAERDKSLERLERTENTGQNETSANKKGAVQAQKKVKRSESVKGANPNRNQAIMEKARQSRDAKLAKLQMRKQKSAERLKIEKYVKSLVPYTRDLSNTRFRSYYGKECMQTYGKNNTNEPIGGIIYGNHMKTFNIGPHSHGNDPNYYQTHNTALNFAKRTKLNEQDNWRRLEKEMGKKLGLIVTNESLKQGKQVNIQQINDDNMYAVMKQNHQFQKQHRDQIRQLEKQYHKEKQQVMKAQAQQFKQQRIADRQSFKVTPLATKPQTGGQASTAVDNLSTQQRLKQQVIYKYTDQNGITRYATDRHAITCYVDLNFPQNDAVYTQQLINRSPIYPIQVREKDRHLDEIRKQNYVDSVVNSYPAHYLVPNVDYSQVKWGKTEGRSRSRSKSIGRRTGVEPGARGNQSPAGLAGAPVARNKSPGINEVRSQQQQQQQRQVQFASQNQSAENGKLKQMRGQENQRSDFRAGQGERSLQRAAGYSQDYSGQGCGCISARAGCGPNIKQVLLQRAERDPHLASKLLSYSRKFQCELNNNQPTQLIQNEVYDPNNYYPHAIHELNPQLYGRVSPERIPYAGLPSSTRNGLP